VCYNLIGRVREEFLNTVDENKVIVKPNFLLTFLKSILKPDKTFDIKRYMFYLHSFANESW